MAPDEEIEESGAGQHETPALDGLEQAELGLAASELFRQEVGAENPDDAEEGVVERDLQGAAASSVFGHRAFPRVNGTHDTDYFTASGGRQKERAGREIAA